MDLWLSSPVQIGLSAAVPVAIALLLILLAWRGPLARAIENSSGLVGPYFGSVGVIFGLFAALLASDAWQKDSSARAAVRAEGDALSAIAQISHATGLDQILLPKIRAYVDTASSEDPYSAQIAVHRGRTGEAYQALLAVLIQAKDLDPVVRASLLGAARDLLRAHDERLHLANDETALFKWLSIIIFGAITQIALLLVHVGNRRAQNIAVGLFTVAFSFCLVVVAIFDAPFETVLSDEPRATLSTVLKTL